MSDIGITTNPGWSSICASKPGEFIIGPTIGVSFSPSHRTCAVCGVGFTNTGNEWHDMCPTCRVCAKCGSPGVAFITGAAKPAFIRCLRCLHGREVSATQGTEPKEEDDG